MGKAHALPQVSAINHAAIHCLHDAPALRNRLIGEPSLRYASLVMKSAGDERRSMNRVLLPRWRVD
jgi:hypothetical protein